MPCRWSAGAGLLLLVVALGACGSESSVGGSGTEIEVKGVATTGSVPPGPGDPGPVAEPGDAIEIDISGSLRCDGNTSTGTGMYEANATQLCLELSGRRAVFDKIAATQSGPTVCSEVYGGPQHASITGSIDGVPIDLDVTRKDGCGIESWQRLEWLLGPPAR